MTTGDFSETLSNDKRSLTKKMIIMK